MTAGNNCWSSGWLLAEPGPLLVDRWGHGILGGMYDGCTGIPHRCWCNRGHGGVWTRGNRWESRLDEGPDESTIRSSRRNDMESDLLESIEYFDGGRLQLVISSGVDILCHLLVQNFPQVFDGFFALRRDICIVTNCEIIIRTRRQQNVDHS